MEKKTFFEAFEIAYREHLMHSTKKQEYENFAFDTENNDSPAAFYESYMSFLDAIPQDKIVEEASLFVKCIMEYYLARLKEHDKKSLKRNDNPARKVKQDLIMLSKFKDFFQDVALPFKINCPYKETGIDDGVKAIVLNFIDNATQELEVLFQSNDKRPKLDSSFETIPIEMYYKNTENIKATNKYVSDYLIKLCKKYSIKYSKNIDDFVEQLNINF